MKCVSRVIFALVHAHLLADNFNDLLLDVFHIHLPYAKNTSGPRRPRLRNYTAGPIVAKTIAVSRTICKSLT